MDWTHTKGGVGADGKEGKRVDGVGKREKGKMDNLL